MIEKIAVWINRVTFVVTALLMTLLVGLVILAVVMRYAVGKPLVYSYDLSTLLFAWTVFLGLSLAEQKGAHLSIVRPEDFVGPRLGRWLEILRLTAMLVIALGTLWFGIKLLGRAVMMIPSMRISIGWLYASLPIGFGLLAVEYFLKLLIAVRGRGAGHGHLAGPTPHAAPLSKEHQ